VSLLPSKHFLSELQGCCEKVMAQLLGFQAIANCSSSTVILLNQVSSFFNHNPEPDDFIEN